MAKGSSKGGRTGSGGSGGKTAPALTDDQMTAEMEREFASINKSIDDFLNHNPKEKDLEDFIADDIKDLVSTHIEKDTVQRLRKTYIDDFNDNVRNYGDGFEFYDPDQVISILYKDGRNVIVSPDWYDGSKKIPVTGIDSIIVDGGWGTAVAGKNVRLYNYRQEVKYRSEGDKYGYRDVKSRYDDFNDIRAEFK